MSSDSQGWTENLMLLSVPIKKYTHGPQRVFKILEPPLDQFGLGFYQSRAEDVSPSLKRTQFVKKNFNGQEGNLRCYQKCSTDHNKHCKDKSHPTDHRWLASTESWFPVYHIYIGLCVNLSMPMLWKQKWWEPSNLSLMQFQLRWHCSHSQTIKVSLWVFNMI